MATFGYCRVSTARQATEGESLDVQRRQIEGYALMQGLTIDEVVVEEGVWVRSRRPAPCGRPAARTPDSWRRRHRAEAGSSVPLRPRRAPGRRRAADARRPPTPSRPWRRHRRQRPIQAVPDDRRSIRGSRARPHPGARRAGQGRSAQARPVPRRTQAIRLQSRRRRHPR